MVVEKIKRTGRRKKNRKVSVTQQRVWHTKLPSECGIYCRRQPVFTRQNLPGRRWGQLASGAPSLRPVSKRPSWTWKQPRCPSTDEWIRKMWYIYTMEYYSAIKKNEIMPFVATWMDLEIIILSEVSQKEKDKYHMISLICGI